MYWNGLFIIGVFSSKEEIGSNPCEFRKRFPGAGASISTCRSVWSLGKDENVDLLEDRCPARGAVLAVIGCGSVKRTRDLPAPQSAGASRADRTPSGGP